MHQPPAIPAASESVTEYQCSRASAAAACGQPAYSAYPQHARKVASSKIRVRGLVTSRLSMGSAYINRTCSIYCLAADGDRLPSGA
jgi:hypothetical protein